MNAADSQTLWFLTRASGAASLILLTAVMVLGILPRTRLTSSTPSRLLTSGLHRTLSLLALCFIGVHVVATVWDSYAPIRLVDAIVPFVSPYRPVWLGLGALALDLFLALTVTSLLRSRVGFRTWRVVHWTSYACWPIALLHVMGTGSDAGEAWLLILVGVCVALVLLALEIRILRSKSQFGWQRFAVAAVSVVTVVALVVWALSGPLAPGWAATAGTPETNLASGLDCLGGRCGEQQLIDANPFCAVPQPLLDLLIAGYRADRSADIFTVTGEPQVVGSMPDEANGASPVWISAASTAATRVPLAFTGGGVPNSSLEGAGLVDVAPTLARMTGTRWPHPEYLEGQALDGFVASKTPLVVVVAWKGVGSDELEAVPAAWPFLRSLGTRGLLTLDAHTGSLPLDSSAVLATVGTGTLPSTHGITGTWLRALSGKVVTAWEKGSPTTVTVATGDVLDDASHGEALVGAVLDEPFDRGIIGGTWFVGLGQRDDDEVRVVPTSQSAATVSAVLARGYGQDATPDLLGVTLEGDVSQMDAATKRIAAAARRIGGGDAVVIVMGTGSAEDDVSGAVTATTVVRAVETSLGADSVVAADSGGIFLDWRVLDARQSNASRGVAALRDGTVTEFESPPIVYSGLSIAFGTSCPGSSVSPSPTQAPMPEMNM